MSTFAVPWPYGRTWCSDTALLRRSDHSRCVIPRLEQQRAALLAPCRDGMEGEAAEDNCKQQASVGFHTAREPAVPTRIRAPADHFGERQCHAHIGTHQRWVPPIPALLLGHS